MTQSAMTVMQAILGRRSIRRFTDEPVSSDNLRTILEAGRWAPSGLNNQPWRFLVIRAGDPRRMSLAECTKYRSLILGAGALIAVFLDKRIMYNPVKDHQGAGACIQNMLLAVHDLGLGGVWLGEILNQEAKVLDVLGLSADDYELMAVIALGHPAQKGDGKRKPLAELLLEEF